MGHEWYTRQVVLTAHSVLGAAAVSTQEECRRCGRPRFWEDMMSNPCYAVDASELTEWSRDG